MGQADRTCFDRTERKQIEMNKYRMQESLAEVQNSISHHAPYSISTLWCSQALEVCLFFNKVLGPLNSKCGEI